MKIAVTGATGFVGRALVQQLIAEKEQVLVLTRNPDKAKRIWPSGVEIVGYSMTTGGEWQRQISGCNGVVNLAGAPIAEERWTAERKQILRDSRILGTEKIVEAIAAADPKPQVLVNTSAIGYYGTSETAEFDETSPAGDDFLAQLCVEWEQSAQAVSQHGVRSVILRFGIVMGDGGAIAKMIPPFKMFAGGPIGSGQQWFSWIHINDLVNLILFALRQPQMQGTFNATAPNPIRMNDLASIMGNILNRPSWLPVPSFVLDALLGDGAKVVLEGQKVLPKKTLDSGFKFQHPNPKEALKKVLQ
ncbi:MULTISPECIES: TIGR01777 family oxidoreductase [unclassified Roseofilum]|uniref:thylakoid membrane protein ThyD n=1 Tax=unclassified Roseofilum TaxID=2620099 RepID=UPI000E9F601B|nr:MULTISPECIES: TIGR01777 family oxidoreductase [unclassified Roseofilum]MBP0009443.1 TIGR01777 family oxidoreductase [Roseofilum sp. Belize Diploria]MBP0035706.1 TIGR01777 family oxidoreductase [Roseofilum sp. Belize BBD 4]HBQ98981.1 TIGR01777 family protein [Cyanobacteria bacterium UBA11691]